MSDIPMSMNAAAEEASEADRQWFRSHPESRQYVRPLIPGEFDIIALGKGDTKSFIIPSELPRLQIGMKWMTRVTLLAPGTRAKHPIQMPIEIVKLIAGGAR